MVISTHTNLIPYDQGQHPMLPQQRQETIVIAEDTVEHHCRFQRPPATQINAAESEGSYGNRYNSNRCWQYADDYQVGGSIDIYA